MQKSGKFPEVILNLSWAILKWTKIQEGQLDILNKGGGWYNFFLKNPNEFKSCDKLPFSNWLL